MKIPSVSNSQDSKIQVVIRLKPFEHIGSKCVEISPSQAQTLVVETDNGKSYFTFDNVVDEKCTQSHLYELIGKSILEATLKGYNCCVFSYGQTGAGKTYSILGGDIGDRYSEERGLLPRLLDDLFVKLGSQPVTSREYTQHSIRCSYMEIYNEQIFDLLSGETRQLQIREDLKRGVHAEGIVEEDITCFEEALSVLLQGSKNRRIETTSMNSESSRSHTIFTIYIESSECRDGVTTVRRSKVNVVDLAGSERVKHTKAEGERLKEGCNINKSLHVLGNVINCLAESVKRKKYVPFRDSKLTYILKDSLDGNSVTKLLANIQPQRTYLADTLSTLMFAKRVKILKLKAEANESVTENFELLRQEIRKLREELAEAKYIRNDQSKQELAARSDSQFNQFNRIATELCCDTSKFSNEIELDAKEESTLQTFEENELHYRALLEIYEQHMENCEIGRAMQRHNEWKSMERKNELLIKLLRKFPAFSKMFKENVMMRREIIRMQSSTGREGQLGNILPNMEDITKGKTQDSLTNETLETVTQAYDNLVQEMTQNFEQCLSKLEHSHEELLKECQKKDEHIKELSRRKEFPPAIESLQNEVDYLKLNIMELENEIKMLEIKLAVEEEERKRVEDELEFKKNSRKSLFNSVNRANDELVQPPELEEESYEDNEELLQRLNEVKVQLIEDQEIVDDNEEYYLGVINCLKEELKKKIEQCDKLKEENGSLKENNKLLIKKTNLLLKIDADGEPIVASTFWSSLGSHEESNYNISEYFEDADKDKRVENDNYLAQRLQEEQNKIAELSHELKINKSRLTALEQDYRSETAKSLELSHQIIRLHQEYSNEISNFKKEIREYELERKKYYEQLDGYAAKNRTLEERYGKGITEIVEEYRASCEGKSLQKEIKEKEEWKKKPPSRTNSYKTLATMGNKTGQAQVVRKEDRR